MNDPQQTFVIEPFGRGFIVTDYSGKRGRFGAAYAGRDGRWRDQVIGIDPFPDEQDARAFADAEVNQLKTRAHP